MNDTMATLYHTTTMPTTTTDTTLLQRTGLATGMVTMMTTIMNLQQATTLLTLQLMSSFMLSLIT